MDSGPSKPGLPTWVKVLPLAALIAGTVTLAIAAHSLFRGINLHKELVYKYSQIHLVDPLLSLAVIQVESGFDAKARSKKGAMGLMQLMPMTAIEEARDLNLPGVTPADLAEPELNINLGTRHLARLQQEFKGDLILTLAAYNAGPAVVKGWLGDRQNLEMSQIPYAETRNFVKKVILLKQCFVLTRNLRNRLKNG